VPRANPGYWEKKLARNVERDAKVTQALTAAGWTVVRIWEHEPAAAAADRITEAVAATSPEPDKSPPFAGRGRGSNSYATSRTRRAAGLLTTR
jgi:DNA mismatch endonuclease (patch repair protein)